MRILLLNTVNERRKHPEETAFPYLGSLYLASYLREYGGFTDITVLDAGRSLTGETVWRLKPDLVGISSVTQNFNIACHIARVVKSVLYVPVVVGGHHITALPNCLSECMDMAVLGEGEQTLLELTQGIEQHDLDKLDKIKGIAYRNHGKLKVTPKRELIEPLDKIPFPARDLAQFKGDNVNVLTSRGCPYRCVFCSSAFFWGRARFFSAEYVLSELEHLCREYKVRKVNFSDDLFIADKRRLREISKLIRESGLHKKVEFRCTARANLMDDSTCETLKAMNVQTVSLGLESASPRQLRFLKGDNVTVEQNSEAVNVLKRWGFSVSGTFIIGCPDETEGEIKETYRFIERGHLDGGDTYVLLPFPGTRLWHLGKERGLLSDDMDWSRFEIYFLDDPDRRVVLSEVLTRKQLKEIMLEFQRLWERIRLEAKIRKALRHPLKTAVKILRRART